MQKVKYEWDEESGVCSCSIIYKDRTFIGFACCHPDDADMKSKLMGQMIAEERATASCLRHIRDNELRPQLRILKQLYYSMNRSKQFTPKSYENIMLQRQIRLLENDLDTIKEELVQIKENTKEYIERKEKEHELIRKHLRNRPLVETD